MHVLASDSHAAKGPRSPNLSPAVKAAALIVGQKRAEAMVVDTPRAIIKDLPVKVDPPRPDETSRRWWRFWGT